MKERYVKLRFMLEILHLRCVHKRVFPCHECFDGLDVIETDKGRLLEPADFLDRFVKKPFRRTGRKTARTA